ncbi:hydantoinase/oxoprolinase family protein [Haloarcula nitratireducens]|uniref:Hydantoinase/oxoprolinase family protein n=1 Tax=Haloarcula nitratireducens TaxID=2487749 RepID=A0AAW4P6P4_9EURY|nr:hydantoinase/oxoprolinase family protein [Halomicroarcula nitratireducens]MBX0293285.1 hydantoinase/oxoprolinase family protein [Halomicroarcula nitratireducens]
MDDSVRLGVDVGGTFTDVVLVAGDGVTTAKVPTTDPQHEGVLAGVATACERAGVDPDSVSRFRHATTVVTNALLEGEGAETALVTTDGFGDVLAIGRQDRPELYDQSVARPDPLVPAERRYELDERAVTGGIERPVDPDAVRDLASDIEADAVAVSLLHAYAHPENERRAVEILREELDAPVSASHEVLSAFREYERTATAAADAYVAPVVDAYLGRLVEGATDRGLPEPRVMQSNGGIADADAVRERAVTTALSGPAAGVVGASAFEPDDADGVVTFDMGGTSSDVSLVRDGAIERTTDADIGGRPVRVPMVDVETVGAGGGSIAWVDAGGALRVGPRSAGADPGPACYGRGGTDPTVTDAALLLGYLGPDTTLGSALSLDADAARDALAALADDADLDGPIAAARGVYRVANATMTRTIRSVTAERGDDPREFAIAAFGGAGPMHAAALADRLGVSTVVVPRASGVLSALGLLAADERHDAVRTFRARLGDAEPESVESVLADLERAVLDDTTTPEAATVAFEADCRYAGQSHELGVGIEDFDRATLAARFQAAHERTHGYRLPDSDVELVTLRATATVGHAMPDLTRTSTADADPQTGTRDASFGEAWHETPVLDWNALAPDTDRDGPAIVEGGESTVVVPPEWSLAVDDRGTLRLEGRA